jgi:hypothetical protein
MNKNLNEVAMEYVGIPEKIERSKDFKKIQDLEEKRADLHCKPMEILKNRYYSAPQLRAPSVELEVSN